MYINRHLATRLWPNLGLVLAVASLDLLVFASHTAAFALVGYSIAHGMTGTGIAQAAELGALAIACMLANGILRMGATTLRERFGDRFRTTLRADLTKALLQAGPQFMARRHCAQIATTIGERVEWISCYYLDYLPQCASLAIGGVLVAAWCLTLGAEGLACCLGALACTVAVLLAPPVFHGAVEAAGRQEWRESDAYYVDCIDGIRGMATLKALNADERHRAKTNAQGQRLRRAIMGNLALTSANSRAIELAALLGHYGTVALAAMSAARGAMAPEQVIALAFALHAWREAAGSTIGSWLRASKGIAGFGSVLEVLEAGTMASAVTPVEAPSQTRVSSQTRASEVSAEPASARQEDGRLSPAHSCRVSCREVSFTHAGASGKALDKVTLDLAPGTTTALVGSSGSGKSTLAQLLLGFYEPQHGEVVIAGTPLRRDTAAEIRSQACAIWQDSHVFHMSCHDNIAIARPGASVAEVEDAARQAGIHDLIVSLPDGYKTELGDGGRTLSGGEGQRIALARAFLRDAPLLILDEATSSLDRKTELEVQACLRRLGHDKTVLVIAHRLDTIRDADLICVMERGRIVERGTHEDLMRAGGRYEALVSSGMSRGGGSHDA